MKNVHGQGGNSIQIIESDCPNRTAHEIGKQGVNMSTQWDNRKGERRDPWMRQKHQKHQNLMNGQSSVSKNKLSSSPPLSTSGHPHNVIAVSIYPSIHHLKPIYPLNCQSSGGTNLQNGIQIPSSIKQFRRIESEIVANLFWTLNRDFN